MGNPRGFMMYERETSPDRPVKERIGDWDEFHNRPGESVLRTQGARCMDCGIPFCHGGLMLAGMTSGCPLHNLIPEWNDLVYRGQWRDALDRLMKTNNFPEFTGRVCPAPCEGSCTLGMNNPSVTIKEIEREITCRAYDEDWITPQLPKTPTGKSVAVVGSGPAGLACAVELNRAGHSVTVFERADRPGGLLMYGIPNMKLDKRVVQNRLSMIEAEGIEFRTGVEVGKDFPAERLLQDFDAAILCCGATRPRDMQVPGRDLDGIHFAMDFLSSNTKALLDSNHADGDFISAKDRRVVVIGGGDTGTDCVGTAIRHGCRSMAQFEIMPELPICRAESNPWPEWPKVLKVDYGQEEAVAIFGQDPRSYCISTMSFVGDEAGRVKEVHTQRVEWVGLNGRLVPVEVPGTEEVWEADLVLLAMGFLGPEDELAGQLGLARDPRSNIRAEYGAYETSVPGIFAAGDARRGQSLVVWAIHEGRGAARACDLHLMGRTSLPG